MSDQILQLLKDLGHSWLRFAQGKGDSDGYNEHVKVLQDNVAAMPLSIAALYSFSIWFLARNRFLNNTPLAYPGIFSDMRGIKRCLAEYFELEYSKISVPPLPESQQKRVLFYTPVVVVKGTTVPFMAMIFSVFKQYWPDVAFYIVVGDQFFVSPESDKEVALLLQEEGVQLPTIIPHSAQARTHIEDVFAHEHIPITLKLTDATQSYHTRLTDVIGWVKSVQPDILLTLSHDSIVDTLFSRMFPTIRFGLGEFLPVISSDADIYVVPHEIKDLIPILQDNGLADTASSYRHVFFPTRLSKPKTVPSRRAFKLSDDIFYVASISRHFGTGIFEDVCAEVRAFVDRHENVRWLLVGLDKYVMRPDVLVGDRIEVIPDSPDSVGLSHVVDVIVPVTFGTGVTALAAMEGGTPVLTLSRQPSPYTATQHLLPTDVAIMVGSELCLAGARMLGQMLERLYADPDYYECYRHQMRGRAQQHLQERIESKSKQFACIDEAFQGLRSETSC